jgi:hypothetical protein
VHEKIVVGSADVVLGVDKGQKVTEEFKKKPLTGKDGRPIKSYGHIPHMPGSRMGPGDHMCDEGQKRIATEKTRDKHDRVILQEKLDGSNVGVAKINGVIVPLTRAGYVANTSPFEQHHHFYNWVWKNQARFEGLLRDGERVCGEWLMQAHGTIYDLKHEPFVVFDLMMKSERKIYEEFVYRVKKYDFISPNTVSIGPSVSAEKAMELVRISGHGALDPVEGAVWRVERNEQIDRHKSERKWVVDFLVKYVRPDKVDGLYLPEQSGKEPVWNWKLGAK